MYYLPRLGLGVRVTSRNVNACFLSTMSLSKLNRSLGALLYANIMKDDGYGSPVV